MNILFAQYFIGHVWVLADIATDLQTKISNHHQFLLCLFFNSHMTLGFPMFVNIALVHFL